VKITDFDSKSDVALSQEDHKVTSSSIFSPEKRENTATITSWNWGFDGSGQDFMQK